MASFNFIILNDDFSNPENYVSKPDSVMVKEQISQSTVAKKGGIDFNASKMGLQIKNTGSGIKFCLDSAMLHQFQNATGFTPVIISIQPMINLQMFLGLGQDNNTPATI